MLEVPVCRLILLSLLLLVISCNKLSTTAESNPINFSGIVSIQNSSDSSVILSWKIPFTVQIENYEIYILPLKAEDLDSLEESPVQKPETKDAASASTAQVQDIAKTVYPPASLLPSSQGKLVSLLSADRNSYRTATLEAGYYLFQVRALSTDGQRDANAAAKLVKIEDNKIFKGMQIAEVIGTDVHLQWLPYPDIRTTDTYQYVIYKGPAFNEKIAFTHDNHYTYSLLKESAGDTLYFGVRFADNKNIEDTNSTLIPLTVPVINKNYLGCLKAEAVGADRIKVTFEWPSENYKGMKIYRDQQEAFVGLDRDVTSFVDRGLVEGETYTYTCQGVTGKDIIAGSNKIKAATLSSNPPNFRGITNALSDSPTTVKISWGVSTGVPAQEFRIYANAGSSVNWAAEPVLKVGPSVLQAQLSKLGDDLPYAFGVRACGVSVCDPNTEQLVITTPDSGAPRSIGAQSALISNGTILITAPWKAEDGGISKRKIYIKMDGDPTPEISLYSLAQTVLVNDPIHPATQLSVGNLVSNKTYHLIVRDEDSHGNISSNTQVVSVTMGDLRPPDFNGISAGGLSVGAAGMEETSLTATFAAIQNSQQHPRGASSYRFYVREGSGPSCAEDYYKFSLDALGIAEGSTSRTIPNLKAKTIYSVCIKAVDKNGNLSINTNYLSRSTLDRTQPDFDGLQSLSFDASKGLINLAWNASASADISSYRIDTWLTLKNSSETIPITINRSAGESPNSYSFDNSVVPFASEATLEVVVNACDNADSISGGSKNCSSFVRSQALKMTFADIEAPPGFMGIAAGPILTANEEGKVIVRWIDPSSWTDYAGFQVFTVDTKNELTLVKDCPCTSIPGCGDHLNACTITGLSDYRTYRFHVRAYDIAKNFTILDPAMSYADKRTIDLTKPTFASNISLVFQDGSSQLTWAAASDNQYAHEPGAAINYRVYRKTSSNFTNLLTPASSGTLLAEVADLYYNDTSSLVSGTYYYYTVCAVDASANEACDGTFKSVQTPDLIAPVISSFTSTKTLTNKTWNLAWTASDNTSSNADLLFRVKAKASASASDRVLESDPTIFTQAGVTGASSFTGPLNTDTYIHYLLMVTDQAGNTTSKQIDIYSQNLISITAVRTNEGPTEGNRILLIEGTGFHSSSTVSIGASNCGSTQIVSSRHILCRTPAKSVGSYSLTISNSDGSSSTLNNAYTYCTANSCTQVCNNPSSWETPFARTTGRGGSSASPYVICDATQLNAVRTTVNYKYYSMGENIDLNGVSWTPLVTQSGNGFAGTFTGNGNVIANLSINNVNLDNVGFFRYIHGNSKISDLKLVNINITARDNVGALAADSAGDANTIIQDIMVSGTISGRDQVGGAIGLARVQTFNFASYGTISGRYRVGGVIGYKEKNASNLSFEGTVSATGSGNTCQVGGLVGQWAGNGGIASDLSARASVSCPRTSTTDLYDTGGLVGRIDSHSLSQSWFDGTVQGDRRVAGAVGCMVRGTLDQVQVTGTVVGGNSTYNGGGEVGGIAGGLYRATLSNSSSKADVTGYNYYIGGLVGYSAGGDLSSASEPRNLIQTSIASGNVSNVIGYRTGGAIGQAERTDIKGSSASGNLTVVNGQAGGFLGYANYSVKIEDSFANGKVDSGATGDNVGGFVGIMESYGDHLFKTSFARGDAIGRSQVGGFAGLCRGSLTDSYATGAVSGVSVIGGFCGRNYDLQANALTIINRCYASGAVSGTVDHIGGFIGHMYRYIEVRNSYASGAVTGDLNVGGFVGSMDQAPIVLENSRSSGAVTGSSRVGGFLGYGYRYDANMTMRNNYSKSDVTGEVDVGGFAGITGPIISKSFSVGKVMQGQTASNINGFIGRWVNWTGGTLSAPECYWDTTVSNRATSPGGSGKKTLDMKDPATFINYDTALWTITSGSYPKLIWEGN